MITISLEGGPMAGATRTQDTAEVDIVFAEYEVTPKVSIRPGELLKTAGPVFYRYSFGSWVIPDEMAIFTYVGGL